MRILFWPTSLLAAALFSPLHAAPVPLEGNWSGTGTVQPTDRAPEKISCRINYARETDKVFRVAAKCATTSLQINQLGQLLMVGPGVYVGEFQIPSYDIAGRIRVVVEGSAQTMTFKSSRAEGSLTLKKS